MKSVFFLLNKVGEFSFAGLIERYLGDCQITIGEKFPQNYKAYDLIVPWCYRHVIALPEGVRNCVVFHSSDLPEGKGWAPIYYALAENRPYHTITGILADCRVDSGDMIVKAKFRIKNNYTAEYIRKWDEEIAVLLIQAILKRYCGRVISAVKQTGTGSYKKRRNPEDSQVFPGDKIGDVFSHLRACERAYPAYFMHEDAKFYLYIEPAVAPEFPADLEIRFMDEMGK